MEIWPNISVIIFGFAIWLTIAPNINSPKYSEMFLAYMAALMLSLIASSELLMIRPTAFFFTIGGVLAFFYVVFKKTIKITIKK